MRFLLDQGVPRSTVAILQRLGHFAEHVGDIGMSAAADDEILDAANLSGAIVVTLDADFNALLAQSRATSPSVIRIRIEGLKAPAIAGILQQIVASAEPELNAGAAVSVSPARFRVKLLPLA